MIRTEHEYKEAARRFHQDRELLDKQRAQFAEMDFSAEEIGTLMEPLLSFHAQLSDEITWYENVCRGNITPSKRFDEVGRLLIASRIASGKTQKQLAHLLNVSESSVSRDERNEYHGITVERAQRIFEALQVEVSTSVEQFQMPKPHRAAKSAESLELEMASMATHSA